MNDWLSYLAEIKMDPPALEFVYGVPLEHLFRAMTSWSACGARLNTPTGLMPENKGERFWWLWGFNSFNPVTWAMNLTFEPFHGFLPRLIQANLIYPDGTINQAFVDTYMSLKNPEVPKEPPDGGESHGTKRKRRDRRSDDGREPGGCEREG